MFICISFLRIMTSLINTENLWSDLLTKDVLTVYTEGLACNNFDKKIIYNVRRHEKYIRRNLAWIKIIQWRRFILEELFKSKKRLYEIKIEIVKATKMSILYSNPLVWNGCSWLTYAIIWTILCREIWLAYQHAKSVEWEDIDCNC